MEYLIDCFFILVLLAFNLFGTKRRRRRNKGLFDFGGGGSMGGANTILALGGLALGGYILFKYGGSFEDAAESTVKALSDTGDWIADGSCWAQEQLGIGSCGEGKERNKLIDLGAGAAAGGAIGAKALQRRQRRLRERKLNNKPSSGGSKNLDRMIDDAIRTGKGGKSLDSMIDDAIKGGRQISSGQTMDPISRVIKSNPLEQFGKWLGEIFEYKPSALEEALKGKNPFDAITEGLKGGSRVRVRSSTISPIDYDYFVYDDSI